MTELSADARQLATPDVEALTRPHLTIEVEGTPVGKGRPRITTRNGRPRGFTPPRTETYEGKLAFFAKMAMQGRAVFEGPLAVRVEAHFPIARSWPKRKQAEALAGTVRPTTKPDADNLLKVLDAFNEIVWRDDVQVVEATIVKRYSDRPRLVVTVEPLA